jgi:hypothetical protein
MTQFDWHPWQFILFFLLVFSFLSFWLALTSTDRSNLTGEGDKFNSQKILNGFMPVFKILFPLLVLITYLFNSPFSQQPAIKYLKSHGFENINITGYNLFSCNGELQRLEFQAEVNNHLVKGIVCDNLFWNYSVQLK